MESNDAAPEGDAIPEVAPRPETRYVEVRLKGAFAGWWCKAKADFPAEQLTDLASGDVGKIVAVLGAIVVAHNFPNSAGELAGEIGKVDPYEGLMLAGTAIFEGLGKLPNR